jgi:hypothetical protein
MPYHIGGLSVERREVAERLVAPLPITRTIAQQALDSEGSLDY